MDKKPPDPLTEEQIKDVESRLGTFPYLSIARVRLQALCAMARERNTLMATVKTNPEKLSGDAWVKAAYSNGLIP